MERIKCLELVSKAVNKKGKLKGKNKKETRGLKAICAHNRYNKNGKLRPTIFNNGNSSCTCTMCGATFSSKIYKGDDLKDAIEPFKALNEQAKYMAAASGAGPKTIDFFAQTGAMLSNYPKVYRKMASVVDKRNNLDKRKKNTSYGSSQYGRWTRK